MRLDCRRAFLVVAALLGLAFQADSPAPGPKPDARAKAQARERGPAIPAVSRRVVLLSLDGASSETLHQLYRAGSLGGGGFSRFFREGMVADALVPVDPTLTSPNHISLATGYPPAGTGIVSNRFHPAGAPFLERVSGFSFPIGAETLWEAVRRQKKHAGVLAWPGADGADARRRADWGLIYVNAAEREAQIVTLSRAEWHPAKPPSSEAPLASRSPLLSAQAGPLLDLFAIGQSGAPGSYDGVVAALRKRRGGTGDGAQATPPLRRGEWGALSVFVGGERAVCRIKVLELNPELASVRLYVGGLYRTRAYPSSFAKELAAADLFWPGAPDGARPAGRRGKEEIDLGTWSEQSERFAGFFGDTLRLGAGRVDWELLMGYMPVIDETGHELLLVDPRQPAFSAERRDAFARARLRVWQAVDRELRRLLAVLDLKRTTLVVVSDHGMAPVHTELDANVLLRQKGLLAAPGNGGQAAPAAVVSAYAVGDGGIAHVYFGGGDAAARESAMAALRVLFTAWRVGDEAPLERVVSRAESAELGLDHPNSGDLILFAREGYSFDPDAVGAGEAAYPTHVNGMHGYASAHSSMHAVYMAIGAEVKPETAAKLRSIDVAARVSAWLGIEKPRPQPPPAR